MITPRAVSITSPSVRRRNRPSRGGLVGQFDSQPLQRVLRLCNSFFNMTITVSFPSASAGPMPMGMTSTSVVQENNLVSTERHPNTLHTLYRSSPSHFAKCDSQVHRSLPITALLSLRHHSIMASNTRVAAVTGANKGIGFAIGASQQDASLPTELPTKNHC